MFCAILSASKLKIVGHCFPVSLHCPMVHKPKPRSQRRRAVTTEETAVCFQIMNWMTGEQLIRSTAHPLQSIADILKKCPAAQEPQRSALLLAGKLLQETQLVRDVLLEFKPPRITPPGVSTHLTLDLVCVQDCQQPLSRSVEDTCSICLTKEATMVCYPCFHLASCSECAQRMVTSGEIQCPICRTSPVIYQHLFRPGITRGCVRGT